jgi:hypothetical protein
MLICMKPRLLRLQKSTNESTWGIGVELGATGPGLTSTSSKAIRTGRLVRWGQRIKGADLWAW